MEKVLNTYQLNIGYRHRGNVKTVADGVEVSVASGQLIALIGPNGSGKSTLLRTLSGLQPALSGKVELGSKPIGNYTANELARQISIVLTEKPAAGNLTVQSLVALGRFPYTGMLGKLSSEDQQKVDWALDVTGLNDFGPSEHAGIE